MRNKNEKGSVIAYTMIAIFLLGLLIATLSQGSSKTASTTHLDQMALYLQIDLKTIQGAVSECAQIYPGIVDANGDGNDDNANPNPPFPLYSDLSSGAAGEVLTSTKCPGAPTAQQAVFSNNAGALFKLIGDTTVYTTRYFTDATEGAYVRITRATSDPLWTEAISRVNAKSSACAVAAVTAAGTCANGCLYYWMVRRATSVLGPEAGCP